MKTRAFQVFDLTLSSNESRQILYIGSYFKVLSATGAVDVTLEGQGTLPDLTSGKGLKDTPYSRLVITDKTGSSNTVQLMCATQEYVDQTYSGTVSLTNLQGAYTNGRATVTAVAVSTLLAADAARRFVEVQNTDTGIYLRLTVDGVDPTIAQGIRIAPGQSWCSPANFAPVGAIKAIAESGSVAVEFMEG